jgi:hypothetical protein
MKKCRLYKEDIFSIICISILGLIGLGLTILFIYLYHTYNNITTNVLCAIFSLIYMEFVVVLICNREKESLLNTLKVAVFLPVIYIFIVFIVLVILGLEPIIENPIMLLNCLMWTIYSMPAFIIVVAILVLCLLGM